MMCRARYELNRSGEDHLLLMVRGGVTPERIQSARAALTAAAERAGKLGEPSRAVHAAANPTELPDSTLPHPEDWRLLLGRFHRTLAGLESQERQLLRFMRADYAMMTLRGEDTDHLLRYDTEGSLVVLPQTHMLLGYILLWFLDLFRDAAAYKLLQRPTLACSRTATRVSRIITLHSACA